MRPAAMAIPARRPRPGCSKVFVRSAAAKQKQHDEQRQIPEHGRKVLCFLAAGHFGGISFLAGIGRRKFPSKPFPAKGPPESSGPHCAFSAIAPHFFETACQFFETPPLFFAFAPCFFDIAPRGGTPKKCGGTPKKYGALTKKRQDGIKSKAAQADT